MRSASKRWSEDGGAVVTRGRDHALRQMQMDEQRRELSHLARVNALGQLSAHSRARAQSAVTRSRTMPKRRATPRRRPVDLPEIDAALGDILTEDRRAAQVIAGCAPCCVEERRG
jgi:hypothetical protein